MGTPKQAKVIEKQMWQDDVCRVVCQMVEPKMLGFIGGQYVIVNSGQVLPNGKLGKRAYSIASSDALQGQFTLIVKRIGAGVGSNFIHNLKVGQMFEFSGPWGRYKPTGDADGGVLCVATDTGITAALGLLTGKAMRNFLDRSLLLWFVSDENYFMSFEQVNACKPDNLKVKFFNYNPNLAPETRLCNMTNAIDMFVKINYFSKVYLSGDGAILRKFKDWFFVQGFGEDNVLSESFFNH